MAGVAQVGALEDLLALLEAVGVGQRHQRALGPAALGRLAARRLASSISAWYSATMPGLPHSGVGSAW